MCDMLRFRLFSECAQLTNVSFFCEITTILPHGNITNRNCPLTECAPWGGHTQCTPNGTGEEKRVGGIGYGTCGMGGAWPENRMSCPNRSPDSLVKMVVFGWSGLFFALADVAAQRGQRIAVGRLWIVGQNLQRPVDICAHDLLGLLQPACLDDHLLYARDGLGSR